MPYKHNWYVKGSIIISEVWGIQTLDELEASNADLIQLIEESDHPTVHVIFDDKNLVSIPVSLIKIRKTLTYTSHHKLGWVVMAGSKKNTIIEFLVSVLVKLVRAQYIRVKTFDDALKYLRKVDRSIDWGAVFHDTNGKL